VSDELLFSLLPYDEVSAFLLLVKARNSSLLTGRPISLFWSVYFCGSVNYMVMFTWLVHRCNATGERVFLKTRLQINFFLQLWTNLLQSLKVLFYRLFKNINNFRIWVLGPRPLTLENLHFAKQVKKTLDKWKRPLFLLNIFKIFFIHVSEWG